ncbi:hypothetical protein ADEAN_000452600 [Angomonas deanei]|uniref:Uncharacterized protein n=1 Tax=Angomonas deanei TaxID=59799 RepID=A0A7G2CB87_9TRYP|nr:hypothetical protein ADEAN_000452600 [Angomonas deanei]
MEDQHVLELLSLFLAKLGDAPLLCKHSCSSEQCAQLEKNWKAIFHAILSSCLSSSNCDEKRLLQMKVFSQLMSYLSAHCSQSAAAKTEDAAHGEKQAKRPREDTERQPCNYAEFLFESPSAVVDAIVKSFSARSEDGQKWLLLQAKGVATRFLFSLHAIVKSYATSHAGSRKQCKTVEEEIRTLFAGLSDRDQDTKKGEWFFDYNASLTVEYLEFLCSQVAGIPELLQSVAPLVPTEEEAFMTSYVNGLFQFILKMDLDKLRCESADRFLRAYALLSECAKVLDQLIHKPSLQNVPLTNFVHKLLVIASSSAVMKARTLSMREVGGPSLWGSLLSACNKVNIGKPRPSVPKRAKADSSHEKHKLLERDNLMDGIWLFVGALLHLEPTRPSQGEPLACLSCEEVLAVVQLFSQNLLYSDAFWRDSALLSFFVPRLFVVILKGRSTQLYDHRVVSRFLSLLFQLTRQAEAASHGEMKQVRLFSIAALCSSLFQTVSHYTSLFTSLNEELDGFSNDLLQIMRRSHLPFASAPSLKYNANRSAVAVERSSEFSLCDLAFVAVGEEEGKNLLRESAFLLQEQSNGPSTNRHSIFHVE